MLFLFDNFALDCERRELRADGTAVPVEPQVFDLIQYLIRNRERVLEAAKAVFSAGGAEASLEAVARAAGVGIGTLYRHFPTRDVLVEAVYRAELAEVAAAAGQLLNRHPPKLALRRWMDRYASFVAAKRGMAESLRAMVDSGAVEQSQTRASIVGAVEMLLKAGVDDGSDTPASGTIQAT